MTTQAEIVLMFGTSLPLPMCMLLGNVYVIRQSVFYYTICMLIVNV